MIFSERKLFKCFCWFSFTTYTALSLFSISCPRKRISEPSRLSYACTTLLSVLRRSGSNSGLLKGVHAPRQNSRSQSFTFFGRFFVPRFFFFAMNFSSCLLSLSCELFAKQGRMTILSLGPSMCLLLKFSDDCIACKQKKIEDYTLQLWSWCCNSF